MSFLPELKIGLLNAWIPVLLFNVFMMIFPLLINEKGAKRAVDTSWFGKREKNLMIMSFIFWYGLFIYSVWVPLQTGSMGFYVGLLISIIGFVFYTIANINYAKAPLNKAITQGLYKVSRNPLYFFSSFILVGISIAAASWIMLIITGVYLAFTHQMIKAEEVYCIKTYGESYRKYMKQVPRYILIFLRENE
ncbi:isoprenylcysteine carboxylmethyltransferase family protein [bacterium]|nr:isoprenylcysteine carboxylmethyltransferase family protein [bacterium]